jgi:hypothetical protein
MMEDFWMPRREGGKGTEITTLPGGQNLGEIQDIEYFQNKLYHALNVPVSRLQASQGFSIGRSQEITRDEIKFNKFIIRLRKKFSMLFSNSLRVQLIAKGIIRPDEWEDLRADIKYDFIEDNHYAELRDTEIMQSRIGLLQLIDPYVGKYYSLDWAKQNILRMDKDEIKDITKQIKSEQQEMVQNAEMQGQLQLAQQQPMMDAQQQQQQDAVAQQQAGQEQQPADTGDQDQQAQDREGRHPASQQHPRQQAARLHHPWRHGASACASAPRVCAHLCSDTEAACQSHPGDGSWGAALRDGICGRQS